MIWYNSVSIGPFQFEIEFEKVNPLTHKLNYATSRVSANGVLGDVCWYGNKSQVNAQIESAKLINNYLDYFDNIQLTETELEYLFDDEGQFSKISHLFYFRDSWGFKRYLQTGKYKATLRDYIDNNFLLGRNNQEPYCDLSIEYDENSSVISLTYTIWSEDTHSLYKQYKQITVPIFFSRCLYVAFVLSILFDPIGGIIKDSRPINEWNLFRLICIPSKVGGYFDTWNYKKMVKKYNLIQDLT